MKPIQRASWLRRKFELWLMHRYLVRFGPTMIQRWGYWQYVDPYGNVFNLYPDVNDHSCPLRIERIH